MSEKWGLIVKAAGETRGKTCHNGGAGRYGNANMMGLGTDA